MSVASINGEFCERVRVCVPQHGAWYADVVMLADPALSGSVTLTIGTLDLVGTVYEFGTRGEQSFARIVAGAGAWGTLLPAKDYHNDAGVKRKLLAEDAARGAGETLETITDATTIGTHYVRRTGPASRTLEAAFGAWHVGFDGVTRIGERPTSNPAAGSYIVEDAEPENARATLTMEDVASVTIGSVLSEGLDTPITVRDMEIEITSDIAVVCVWGGGSASSMDRLGDAMRTLIGRATEVKIWGKRTYRVSEMDGDRVKLQAINRSAELPDILPVSMFPGVAGVHAALTPGATVAVEFLDGDPARPVVTGFVGKDGTGFVPVSLTLDASTEIKVGASASDFVALAAKVLTELQDIKSWADTHTHTTTATVSTGSAGVVSAPTTPMPAPSSVAATLVKAE